MISVLVAVYNVEDYINRCIESVISQTYKDLEVILVDDGSTDSSGDICEDFARRDGRVKVVHKENEGLSSARNTGLEAAIGDYILMIDGDDVLHPQMIEILYKLLISGDYDFSMCYGEKIYDINAIDARQYEFEEIPLVRELSTDYCMRNLYSGKGDVRLYYSVVWDKLYKRELLVNRFFKRLPSKDVAQDLEFNNRIYLSITKAILCPLGLYYYVQRTSSLQHLGISSRYVNEIKTVYECLCEIPPKESRLKSYCLRCMWRMMYNRCYWSIKTPFYEEAVRNRKHFRKATVKEFLSNPYIPVIEKISLTLFNFCPFFSELFLNTMSYIASIKK